MKCEIVWHTNCRRSWFGIKRYSVSHVHYFNGVPSGWGSHPFSDWFTYHKYSAETMCEYMNTIEKQDLENLYKGNDNG